MRHNVREIALDLLIKVDENQAFSNLLLNQTIQKYNGSTKDIGLLTEIVYGTIQRKMTLDYYLTPFLKNPKKVEMWVLMLLRLSLYQFVYLDRIPARAIIHEAVEIAKKRGHRGISSFVNGVLRSIQRKGIPSIEQIKDPYKRLSIEMSFPLWLIKRWTEIYGYKETKEICHSFLSPPKVTARVNKSKLTVEDAISLLKKENIIAEKGQLSEDAIIIEKGNAAKTNLFQKGFLSIQDESSMLVARALGAYDKEKVLDACAAPGGKTTHIAELLKEGGSVTAVDLYPQKIQLIKEQVQRLHLKHVSTLVYDSTRLHKKFPPQSFDAILVDAPCSGFGVIRRKPDIKYSKVAEDIASLADVQRAILNSVSSLLKDQGRLVYSTCTIDPEENHQVVQHFLEQNPNFQLDSTLEERLPNQLKPFIQNGQVQILPHYFETDGFFIASFRKQV